MTFPCLLPASADIILQSKAKCWIHPKKAPDSLRILSKIMWKHWQRAEVVRRASRANGHCNSTEVSRKGSISELREVQRVKVTKLNLRFQFFWDVLVKSFFLSLEVNDQKDKMLLWPWEGHTVSLRRIEEKKEKRKTSALCKSQDSF